MAASEIAKAYVQIIPSAEGISGSITSLFAGEATSAGTETGTSMGSSLLSGLKKALPTISVAAIATGVVKAFKACVDESMEFDSAMSQVAATMGTTTDQCEELTEFAKEMGRTTAFSATEAAEGLNTLALAGLDADEQIEVLPTVLNLASAGCLSLDDAAAYVTGTIKGFGSSMEDAEYYADLMAKGATLANTDVNDLGEAMSDSAATAASYGQEADSVALSLLRLAEQNVTGSEASTALNRAMADLYTPTDAAKGALEELGIACYDANGEARDFNDIVDDLDTALNGYSTEQRKAYEDTIFTTRGMQAFDKMCSSSSDTVDGFKDGLADCAGSAMQQAETQLDNLEGDITLFQSAMSGLKIAVGEALTPALRSITEFGTNAITTFTNIITGQVDWKESFGNVIDSVAEKVGITDWPGLGNLMSDGIGNGFATIVQDIPSVLSDFVSTVETKISETDWKEVGYNVATAIIGGLGDMVKDIPGTITTITSNISDFLKDVDWQQVGYDIMTFVLNGIKLIIVDIPQAIADFTSSIVDKIQETDWLQVGKDIIQGIIDGITNIVPDALSSVGKFCSGIFSAFTDFFKTGSPSKLMEDQGGNLVDGLTIGLKPMEGAMDAPLEATAKNVSGWASNLLQKGTESGSGFISNISGKLQNLVGTVNAPMSSALSSTGAWSSDMQASSSTMASQFISKMSDGLSAMAAKVNDQLAKVTEKASTWGTSLSGSFNGIGGNAIQGMINGINSKTGSLYNSIKSACSGLVDKACKALKIGSPSKIFRNDIGAMVGEGMALGIEDSESSVYDAMDDMLSIPSMAGMTVGGGMTAGGNSNVYNVTQNIYSQAQTAAALMKEARYEARRAVMCGV